MHTDEPELENEPASHVVQTELPVPAANLPAEQIPQLSLPATPWKLPGGHAEQLPLPGEAATEPIGQFVQPEDSNAAN